MSEFKVGDVVRLLSREDNGMDTYFQNGNTYVVEIVKDHSLKLEGSLGGWVDKNDIELVPPQLTPKYNIGDKVKSRYSGSIYTIDSIGVVYNSKSFGSFKEEDIELYIEPKIEELTVEQICKELGRDIKIIK